MHWIEGWNLIERGDAVVERVHIITRNKWQSSIKVLSLTVIKGMGIFLKGELRNFSPSLIFTMDLITVLSQPVGIPSKLITKTLTPPYQNVPSYIKSPSPPL